MLQCLLQIAHFNRPSSAITSPKTSMTFLPANHRYYVLTHSYSLSFDRASNTRGWGGQGTMSFPSSSPHLLHLFLHNKNKKEKKGKKRKSLKAETFKFCHQGQNVTVLAILELLEFIFFFLSVADNTFQCFMAPPL